jgi:hypothetical protein
VLSKGRFGAANSLSLMRGVIQSLNYWSNLLSRHSKVVKDVFEWVDREDIVHIDLSGKESVS